MSDASPAPYTVYRTMDGRQVRGEHHSGRKVVHEHRGRGGDPGGLPLAGVHEKVSDVCRSRERAERDCDPEDAEEQQWVGGSDRPAPADPGDGDRHDAHPEHRERRVGEQEHERRRGANGDERTPAERHGLTARDAWCPQLAAEQDDDERDGEGDGRRPRCGEPRREPRARDVLVREHDQVGQVRPGEK